MLEKIVICGTNVCEFNIILSNCGTNVCEWGLSWEKKNVNVIELDWKLLVFFTLMCLYLPCLNMKAPPVCVWACWKWRWEKIISQKILNCGTNVCELTLAGATLRDKCLRIQRKFANINPANISPAIICPALINTNKVVPANDNNYWR